MLKPSRPLTPGQQAVFNLLINGLSNRVIADLLNVEVCTVKLHCTAIYRKYDVEGRYALIARMGEK